MNWLQRLFTLPKSRNSLSDILGQDAANALNKTVVGLLSGAIDSALAKAVDGSTAALQGVAGTISAEVHKVIDGVTPVLSTEIDHQLTAVVGQIQTALPNQVSYIKAKALDALKKLFKL